MVNRKPIDQRAVDRINPIFQRFLDTGDLDTLYNALYFLSLDLEDARKNLEKFDSLIEQADKLRQRNYRLVERLKTYVTSVRIVGHDVLKVKEKGQNKSRKIR